MVDALLRFAHKTYIILHTRLYEFRYNLEIPKNTFRELMNFDSITIEIVAFLSTLAVFITAISVNSFHK